MLQEIEQPTDRAAAEAGMPAGRANFRTVLRQAGFRNLWLGQIVSQIGDYFSFLALLVVASSLTQGDAQTTQAVAGMMIAFTLPRLLFGVLAGVFVDRWDRRRTMFVSDVARAGLAFGLIPAFLSHQLWAIYVLAFALSTVGTLFIPAKTALIPWLVPAEQLTAANALSQTSQMLAQFVGPALAGATFAAVGAGNQWVAFAVDGVSYLVSAGAIWLIRLPRADVRAALPPAASRGEAIRRVWAELVVGLRALVLNQTIAVLAAVFTLLNLGVAPVNVLWVVYLRTQFGFTAADLAWRVSITDIGFAAGMVLASVLVGNWAAHVAPKWLMVVGFLGCGALVAVVGYLPAYWLLVVTLAMVGMFVAPIMTGTQTLQQMVVPNEQMGRVGGGLGTVADTATLVSTGLAGVLAGLLGVSLVFVLAGALCVAAGLLAWAGLPARTAPVVAGQAGA